MNKFLFGLHNVTEKCYDKRMAERDPGGEEWI